MVEGTGGIDFILPIIMAVVVSNWVSHHIHQHGAYEVVLKQSGISWFPNIGLIFSSYLDRWSLFILVRTIGMIILRFHHQEMSISFKVSLHGSYLC